MPMKLVCGRFRLMQILTDGAHTAKAHFEITTTVKSGYGRSVNFFVGTKTPHKRRHQILTTTEKKPCGLLDFSY